jgi:protoheme ferro-lyase
MDLQQIKDYLKQFPDDAPPVQIPFKLRPEIIAMTIFSPLGDNGKLYYTPPIIRGHMFILKEEEDQSYSLSLNKVVNGNRAVEELQKVYEITTSEELRIVFYKLLITFGLSSSETIAADMLTAAPRINKVNIFYAEKYWPKEEGVNSN